MTRQKTRTEPMVSRRDLVLGTMSAGALLALAACSDEAADQAGEPSGDTSQEDATAPATTAPAAMVGEPWVSSNLIGNLSADYEPGPEEDFYVHVNRDWLLTAGIEEGRYQNKPYITDPARLVEERCIELLDEGGSDDAGIRSAQNYFALLCDWDGRDAAGLIELEDALARIDAVASVDELTELITQDHATCPVDLLALEVTSDLLDGSRYAVYAGMNVCSIHEDPADYADPSETGAVELEMDREVFMLVAGKTGIAERAEEIYDASLAYQTEMAKDMPTSADYAQPGFAQRQAQNRYTKAELTELLGPFPTEAVLAARGFADADEFVLMAPEADAHVGSCYDEEHLASIKAALMTALVKDTYTLLTKEIYKAAGTIRAELRGNTFMDDERTERRNAYNRVVTELKSPVAQLYVSRYADDELRTEIRTLCEQTIAAYKDMLERGEDWLSDETRAYAIEKLDAMRIMSLYPDSWDDYSALDVQGASEGETLWSAWLKVDAFARQLAISHVGQQVDEDKLPECIEANCANDVTRNTMSIYVGFMSPVTFERDMAVEEKLGRMGMIVGHEISHAIDTTGRMYDKTGATADWWTEEDLDAFQGRAQRVVDWYDENYRPLGKPYEGFGVRVVGETIADLGGLSCALSVARTIDGFDYDTFFRAYADMWRRLDNDYAFRYSLQNDVHPMENTRCNLVVSQCDEFLETYGVREGDKMYVAPEDRILVW